MTEPSINQPRRILVATDLSARCDRALDRAVELASTWGAELFVLHALEQPEDFYESEWERRLPSWRRPLDPAVLVEEQIRQDLLPSTSKFPTIVEKGEPTDAITRVAQTRAFDLIVTGLARDETLGRFRLGGTVERLLSRLPAQCAAGHVRRQYYA